MKKYNSIILTLLLFAAFHSQLSAQAKLGLFTTSISSSTPNLGDQLYIFTSLKNYSTVDTFIGVIDFELANEDSIITNATIVGKPPYTKTSIKLAPLEEKSALFTVQILPSYFKVGPDIIIVWPIAAVPIIDTASAPIVIQSPLHTSESSLKKINLFILNNQLCIQNIDSENLLEQVQIINLNGQIISTTLLSNNSFLLPIGELSKGIYIARLVFRNGETKKLKFIN